MDSTEYGFAEKKYVYIVLTNSCSIVSKLITIVKKDQFTHVSISLDKNLEHMFSFGRIFTPYPFLGGFKQEKLRRGFYARNKTLPGVILQLEVTPSQYHKVAQFIAYFAKNKSQFHYDMLGFFCHIFDIPITRKNRYTCSKFVADVLEEAKVYSFDKPLALVRPQDFLGVPTRSIYCGDLKQYARSSYLYRIGQLQQQAM